VKKILICLSAVTACGALLWSDASIRAQAPVAPVTPAPAAAAPAAQPARPRIALVNIAKVLREYNKANYDGQNITKMRQEYVDKARPYREKIAEIQRKVQGMQNIPERDSLVNQGKSMQRSLEDIEQEAQKKLSEVTDNTIVEVYQNIKAVINDIAVTNNLDLVMCFPDASTPEEDKKPTVAQLKLQSPALFPMYHRGMDITEVVIVTLNRRHPAPPVAMTPPAGGQAPAPAPAPMGNITPASGPGKQ
jgi:Skp family chaperone for outer membrane proteins